jgi:hypothetical protein
MTMCWMLWFWWSIIIFSSPFDKKIKNRAHHNPEQVTGEWNPTWPHFPARAKYPAPTFDTRRSRCHIAVIFARARPWWGWSLNLIILVRYSIISVTARDKFLFNESVTMSTSSPGYPRGYSFVRLLSSSVGVATKSRLPELARVIVWQNKRSLALFLKLNSDQS